MHEILGDETKPAKISRRGRMTRRGRPRLLNRESLDGRTITARVFDQLVANIHSDMGGRDRLSAIELALCEAFAGAAVTLDHLNTQILAGAAINNAMVAMHAQSISAMVRVAAKLGTSRRVKLVPSMDEWLAQQARTDGEIPESEVIE